jgi:hypothetical protein
MASSASGPVDSIRPPKLRTLLALFSMARPASQPVAPPESRACTSVTRRVSRTVSPGAGAAARAAAGGRPP